MRNLFSIFILITFTFFVPSFALAGPVIIKDLKRSKSAWFYNKPGATANDVNRDEYNCTAFGHHMFTMSPYNDGDPFIEHSGIMGSLIGGAVSSGPIRGSKDDCMMSLGYRRFNTQDANFKKFSIRYELLTDQEKDKYHGAVIPPEGKLKRQWVNTFWINKDGEPTPQIETRNYMPARHNYPKKTFIHWDVIEANETMPLIANHDGMTVLVAQIANVSKKPINTHFMLVESNTGAPKTHINKKGKERASGFILSQKNRMLGEYAVFLAPAGHYAVNMIGHHAMCMETVIFEAKAGEIVFLGDYTGYKNKTKVHPLAPTPRARFRLDSNDPIKVKTDLNLEKTPTPANYQNNFPMQCPPMIAEKMYGISFPNKPSFK